MLLKRSLTGLGVVAALLSPAFGVAQEGPSGFFLIQTLTVAPGMNAAGEEIVRQVHTAYKQTGAAPQTAVVYSTAMGGDTLTYTVVIPFSDWNELDTWRQVPVVLAEAYGEEEAARMLATGITVENRIQVIEGDVSSGATRGGAALYTVIRTEVDVALLDDYYLYLAKLKEAEETAGITWERRRTIRGPLNEFFAVRAHDTFGDTVPNAYQLLRDHLGPAEADPLIERQLAAVQNRDIRTYAYRPDLSRVAGN